MGGRVGQTNSVGQAALLAEGRGAHASPRASPEGVPARWGHAGHERPSGHLSKNGGTGARLQHAGTKLQKK